MRFTSRFSLKPVMMRCCTSLMLTAFCTLGAASPSAAGDWSVFAGLGGGDCRSLTADFSLRHTLDPLHKNSVLELRPLLEASGTVWKKSAEHIWGAGVAAGVTAEFRREGAWRPYLSGSFGTFLLSADRMGTHRLGGHFQFRSRASAGIRFGEGLRHCIQADAAHFSNGGIYTFNSGFNTFGLSYGFRF